MKRTRNCGAVLVGALAWWLALATADAAIPRGQPKPSASSPTNQPKEVELHGRVVCLAEEMHRAHGAELPTRHEHLWGIKTADGRCYTLLRGRFSEAIFLDAQVRERELSLKARRFPGTQLIEVTSLRSVRDGVVQDLYYYCDICDIESVSPEPCGCCQGPVVLVEKPLTTKSRRK